MKKIFKTIFILLTLISCEDVIDVDVNNAEPRLVIDASIHWIKGTNGNTQLIQLSLTAPYFDDSIPPATGANVAISDSNRYTSNLQHPTTRLQQTALTHWRWRVL